MKSRAALLFESPGRWEVRDVDVDPPKDHEVLVRMVASGLCHSDVHYNIGDQATPEQVERIRQSLGLDRPFLIRFGEWLWQILHGDLGTSIFTNLPVAAMIVLCRSPSQCSKVCRSGAFAAPLKHSSRNCNSL